MSQDEVVFVEERSAGSPVRTLLIALGAVVVLGLLWLFVISPLLGGDGDDAPITSQGSQATGGAATGGTTGDSATDTGGETVTELPIETYEVFLARDPFQPVITGVANTTGGTGGTTGDGSTGGTGGTATGGTTTGGTGGTGGTTTGGGCVSQGETVCDGQVVSLVDVFVEDGQERAIIQVDSTLYTVGEGDLFAANFRVLTIDPPCVTLLYGDDRFSLCEGEQVLK